MLSDIFRNPVRSKSESVSALIGIRNKLPEEQRLLVEGYYYRSDTIEKLAEESSRTVAATYKMLQRLRLALQSCIENAAKPEGIAP